MQFLKSEPMDSQKSTRRSSENTLTYEECEDTLTYEESEVRLIMLGFISSLAFLTCGTAFMLITNRISGYYKDPIVLDYKDKERIGFPDPKLLFVNYSGDYTIYSPISNTLGKLPNLNQIRKAKRIMNLKAAEFEKYKIYGAEYKNNLYFMYSDQSTNVIKYDLYTKKHRIIKNTPSANVHMGVSSGIQIGKYFWIILGEDIDKKENSYGYLQGYSKLQLQSSLWSFEKERWFEGPSLHGLLNRYVVMTDYCIVSVERNTVYLLIDVYLLSYNFDTFQWTNQTGIQFWEFSWNSVAFPTCAFYQDKMYRRYIYVSGVVKDKEVNDTRLHWEIMRYSIDTDTWVFVTKYTNTEVLESSKVVTKYTNTEKYGGLTAQLQDNLIQIFSSHTFADFEITKITTTNYEQKMLLKQNTVEFDPFQGAKWEKVEKVEKYHTLSIFHTRNYKQT